jgi:gamma-glutamyl-gamma-aminobutyrate hydrolase PuuD
MLEIEATQTPIVFCGNSVMLPFPVLAAIRGYQIIRMALGGTSAATVEKEDIPIPANYRTRVGSSSMLHGLMAPLPFNFQWRW